MGDQWLKDFEKAKASAKNLARDVHNQDCAKLGARQAALFRGQMAQLRQEVSHLQQSLMAMSQNTQAYNVTRKELSRRGDVLSQLQEQVDGIQEAVRSGARQRVESDSSSPPWRDRGDGRNGGRVNGAVDSSNVQALCEQEIEQQDETLDFLHGTVQNLKNMGGDMNQEIDLHNRLLGDLEEQSDNATGKLKKQSHQLSQLSESASCFPVLYIGVLLVILFVLLVFF